MHVSRYLRRPLIGDYLELRIRRLEYNDLMFPAPILTREDKREIYFEQYNTNILYVSILKPKKLYFSLIRQIVKITIGQKGLLRLICIMDILQYFSCIHTTIVIWCSNLWPTSDQKKLNNSMGKSM